MNYTKYDGEWWADCICAAEFCGWVKFDISEIPDSATINSIVLRAHDMLTTPKDSLIDVFSMDHDPVITNGRSLQKILFLTEKKIQV